VLHPALVMHEHVSFGLEGNVGGLHDNVQRERGEGGEIPEKRSVYERGECEAFEE